MSTSTAVGAPDLLPPPVASLSHRCLRADAQRAAARALRDLDVAVGAGAERLLLTLDPSDPGASAVLEALRATVGQQRVTTRPAGASVLVDVVLDAA